MAATVEVHDEFTDVDLSQLISLQFLPLQHLLRDILQRLGRVEKSDVAQNDDIARLTAEMAELDANNKALQEQLDAKADKEEEDGESETDAIWDEIARLNGLLGELQEGAERDRHTIDDLYAARKRKSSVVPHAQPSPTASGGASTSISATAGQLASPPAPSRKPSEAAKPLRSTEESEAMGDVILNQAHEALEMGDTQRFAAFAEPAGGSASPSARPTSASAAGASSPRRNRGSVSVSIFASRPTSGALGGEDAGEHRGSMAAGQRRSLRADQRITAAAARRASQMQSSGTSLDVPSVFEKLRRDGDDIAYLNRVVAEMLSKMKGLNEDVDQLRTQQDNSGSAGLSSEELDDLRRRLAQAEQDVEETRQQTQRRDDALQNELDELKKQLRVARSLTDDDLDAVRGARDLAERLRQLEDRLRALEAAQALLQEQFESVLAVGENGDGTGGDVNAVQFAALQGAVKSLEKQLAGLLAAQGSQEDLADQVQKLTEAVRRIEGDVEVAQDQVQRLAKETARLEETKANRAELPDAALLMQNMRRRSTDGETAADLAARLSRAEANIQRLDEDKADRSALHKLRDELNALRQIVELLNAQRREGLDGTVDGRTVAAMEKLLRELQDDVNVLKEGLRGGDGGGLSGADADDLRDRIDRLDHCKADATLVANKAERDYVENALERLMREVEQVLNATNAGLIDTLEKSLNILRDMIDGKATKQDVANLQGWMADANGGAGAGGAADGLTGFKGFRCLGCNRPMDNMRPRTLAASMTPFLNRNPQNLPQDNVTRTIQQQQQATASYQQHQQQKLGGPSNSFTAGSRQPVGSPDASLHRSTHSEPLPPIE